MTSNSTVQRASNRLTNSKASWIILAGVVLFFLPEPITSVIGAVVIVVGLLLWLIGKAF